MPSHGRNIYQNIVVALKYGRIIESYYFVIGCRLVLTIQLPKIIARIPPGPPFRDIGSQP